MKTYNPHTLEPLVHSSYLQPESNFLIGVFIDPGIRNCAIRVCKNDLITQKIETIAQLKFDFKNKKNDYENFNFDDTSYFANSIEILNEHIDLFKFSHYIVMEKQLKINFDLTKFSQHLVSYFIINLKDLGFRPLIFEIDPKQKSHQLGGKFKMTKPELKVWCKNKAIEILKTRGDTETLEFLMKCKKQDDHGDTICYDEVWWLYLTNKTFEIPIPIKKNFNILILD
jgi:hypothetical protein